MRTILQRICWNTRGWQLPSGSASHEKGFPSQHGFGHEEWNLQREDAFNGFLYGYTYTRPDIKKSGKIFRIIFFAIHPTTKARVVVGIYNKAELIPNSLYTPLYAHYNRSAVFRRRAAELADVTSLTADQALQEVRKAVKEHWLSVRCPVSDVEMFAEHRPLSSLVGNQSFTDRFKGFTYCGDEPNRAGAGGNGHPGAGHAGTDASLIEDAYYRESQAKLDIIVPRHKKLANQFCNWLKDTHSIPSIKERYRVDVHFKIDARTVMAELKICYAVGTTKAIREALGQLLEYNHYPQRDADDTWIIILDETPSDRDLEYVRRLRGRLSLPLFIGWQDGAGFSFHPQWPHRESNRPRLAAKRSPNLSGTKHPAAPSFSRT